MRVCSCIIISIAAGLAICLFAAPEWRLVGVFCAGGGCYAAVVLCQMRGICREVERYESTDQPLVLPNRRFIPDLVRRAAAKNAIAAYLGKVSSRAGHGAASLRGIGVRGLRTGTRTATRFASGRF